MRAEQLVLGGFRYEEDFDGYIPWLLDDAGSTAPSFNVYHGCYLSMGTELICEAGQLPEDALVHFVDSGEDAILESGGAGSVLKRLIRGVKIYTYGGTGGGHHILSQALFRGDELYLARRALAIPNDELLRLGIAHSSITSSQRALYREAARSGTVLTLDGAAEIEIRALVRAGMPREVAEPIVRSAVDDVLEMDVLNPSYFPHSQGVL